MALYSTFPNSPSIPPVCFYNTQGLAGWLNHNPSYKQYFINQPDVSLYLLSMTSTLSSIGYNTATVPLASFVTTLSQGQALQYNEQIKLFRKVYAYNSNAYVESTVTGKGPVYFRFQTYQEYAQYKSSVALVNKMYPFNAMANGKNDANSTIEWIVPFPL
jgi:hypothetical protein